MSLFEANLFEELRIKTLEQLGFLFMQFRQDCSSTLTFLSTNFPLAGVTWLGVHLTYIEDGGKRTCPRTL